jgi:pimeloyl-ACP methyl ester carboxylesterase
VPGGSFVLAQSLRLKALRRAPFAFGWLAKRPIDAEVLDGWARPIISDPAVRRDATKLLKGISRQQTLEAAERLRSFDRPVLLAWAPEDRFFKFEHAERLAREIPDARLERVEDSYTFVSEDQPKRVAELIAAFVRETSAPAA